MIGLLGAVPTWQAVGAIMLASALVAFVIEVVVVRLARRLVRRTETDLDKIVVQEVRWPMVITSLLVGVFVVTHVPGAAETLAMNGESLRYTLGQPALTFLVFVWAWPSIRIVDRAVEELKEGEERLDFVPVFSNIWTGIVLVGALAVTLHIWNIDITPLLAAGGVAGVAAGIAAEDTISNFFGGVAIYFDDTYKVGDYVELDSGTEGTVVAVGVRSTTLRTRDEILVTIPNAELNEKKVFNQSAPGRRRRIDLTIGVDYDTDMDAFEELAETVVSEDDLVLDTPQPRARLLELGDSALVYSVFCWVPEPSPRRVERTKHRINRKLVEGCQDHDIGLPAPQREVDLSMDEDAGVDVSGVERTAFEETAFEPAGVESDSGAGVETGRSEGSR